VKLTKLFDENRENRDHWDGKYKIPWDDTDFSRRMLAEHLCQDHDKASRREKLIDTHVHRLHEDILNGEPSRVLDLGCGPGFYSEKLAALGHRCVGIDFSPASIDYALKNSRHPDRCKFVLGDICKTEFGEDYDLAIFLFGEFNVFPPRDVAEILVKIYHALRSGGRVLIEAQTLDLVRQTGETEDSWFKDTRGLFSERPHICLMTNHWYPDDKVTEQEFIVIDAASANVTEYRSTTQGYDNDELTAMLRKAGFDDTEFPETWDSGHFGPQSGFFLVQAVKK